MGSIPVSLWFLSPFPLPERDQGFLFITISLTKGLHQAFVIILGTLGSQTSGTPSGPPTFLGELMPYLHMGVGEFPIFQRWAACILWKRKHYCWVFIELCVTVLEDLSLSPHNGELLKVKLIKSQWLINLLIQRMTSEVKHPQLDFTLIYSDNSEPCAWKPATCFVIWFILLLLIKGKNKKSSDHVWVFQRVQFFHMLLLLPVGSGDPAPGWEVSRALEKADRRESRGHGWGASSGPRDPLFLPSEGLLPHHPVLVSPVPMKGFRDLQRKGFGNWKLEYRKTWRIHPRAETWRRHLGRMGCPTVP